MFALFSLLSYGLALNSGNCCQMGRGLHRTRERSESIRKWQLFSCARRAGQLPGPIAKVPNRCDGQQFGVMGWVRVMVGILEGMEAVHVCMCTCVCVCVLGVGGSLNVSSIHNEAS